MDELPFIDRHGLVIEAGPAEVWKSLVDTLPRWMGTSHFGVYARLIGTSDHEVNWDAGLVGSTLIGFHVTESERPSRLVLSGHHRFSRYRLIWTIDEVDPGKSHIQAETRAVFPGVQGRMYRALVIGSSAHARILRRVLASISRQATAA